MAKGLEPGSILFEPAFSRASKKGEAHIPQNQDDVFFEQLKKGYYIGILEDYMERAKWPVNRVARDAWQNFFDTNGYTLDGLNLETLTEKGTSTILIRGSAHYPFTRLLHLGGGHKEDRGRSAGGHGEGAKVAALHLLRDYGCSKVIFGCDDWELEFYLAPPPKGSTEHTKLRGLHARLTKKDSAQGNYLRIETTRPELVSAFRDSRNYFRNAENPDFKELYKGSERAYENEVGGFIYYGDQEIAKKSGARGKGNFYLNGQRISYATKNTWDTIPGFTFWSSQTPKVGERALELSRDRDVVSVHELESIFFPFFVEHMSDSELEGNITLLKEFYKKTDSFQESEGVRFLKCMARELTARGGRCIFDQNMVAADYQRDRGDTDTVYKTLEMLGFTICHGDMGSIGMQQASELYPDLMDLNKIESSAEHRERIRILQEVAGEIIAFAKKEAIPSSYIPELKAKDVHLFYNEHPFLQGMYDEDFVWIRKSMLEGKDFYDVLATYLHELCHKFGTDESAIFSYVLTDVIRVQGKFASKYHAKLAMAEAQWKNVKFAETDDSIDIQNALERILGKKQKSIDTLRLRAEDIARDAQKIRWMVLGKTGRDRVFATDLEDLFNEIRSIPRMQKYHEQDLKKPVQLTKEEEILLAKRSSDLREIEAERREKMSELKKILNPYQQTKARKIPGEVRLRREILEKELKNLDASIRVQEENVRDLPERDYAYRKWLYENNVLLLDLIQYEETMYGERIFLLEFSDTRRYTMASLKVLREYYEERQKAGDKDAIGMFKQEMELLLTWCRRHIEDGDQFRELIILECTRVRDEIGKNKNNTILLVYAKRLIEFALER